MEKDSYWNVGWMFSWLDKSVHICMLIAKSILVVGKNMRLCLCMLVAYHDQPMGVAHCICGENMLVISFFSDIASETKKVWNMMQKGENFTPKCWFRYLRKYEIFKYNIIQLTPLTQNIHVKTIRSKLKCNSLMAHSLRPQ